MICVRFAPSPTGHLHIGGVRTALFNYLYARNQGGSYRVRIEDTDRERSKPEFEKEILSSLAWLGMKYEGELVRQSTRTEHYRALAAELAAKGLAYEESREGKGTAVRFRMPKKKAVFHDLVHGAVEFDTALFDDLVIMKSDGYPTYHWACVVDDHDMAVSHIIRGDDHLSNTPRQIMLYEAMGWKAPKFAHLPLIMGDDGTPLSKRHGAVSLNHFKEEGYLPEGLLNYLALLGWGAADNQEFYSMDQMIKKFSLKRVNKANARFNTQKLDWINAQHLKKLPEDRYLKVMTEFFPEESARFDAKTWKGLLLLYRSRVKKMKDLLTQASYFFTDEIEYENATSEEFLKNRTLRKHIEAWLEKAQELADFEDPAKIEAMTRDSAQGWGIEAGDLIHPLRFSISGTKVTPGLFELMSVLGKKKCLQRVSRFLEMGRAKT